MELLEKFSFVLLVLNSIQASVLPLFIRSNLPPNLYYTIRIFSSFIYGEIPMWNEDIKGKNDYEYIRFTRIGFKKDIFN
jgi:hypothetical protein